ncbi:MAG: ArsR family transcriptional regulator [Gemmatimonadetes bacterium]|nr:ArsR family transcriptional regulator [Gemmatimonadota bacterium]
MTPPISLRRVRRPLTGPASAATGPTNVADAPRSPARNAAPTGDTALGVVDARLKSVADPTRLRILNLLAAGELCVCDDAHYRLAEPGDPVHRAILTCVDACAARVPTLVAERVVAAQHAAERARQPCD